MNKSIKIIMPIILMLIIIFITPLLSEASFNPNDYNPTDSTFNIGEDTIRSKANNIIGVIRNVGVVISVLMLVVLGIKFMLGSVEEKAEYKKTMLPYFIGAIMVFAIPQLVQIIYNIVASSSIGNT